jgi:L-alanine-DL-glutamate epimerase-like enolase superfamily enzyme
MPNLSEIRIDARLERWRFQYPFRISGYEWTDQEVLVVELEHDGMRGRGECLGVYYHDDSPEHCKKEVLRVANRLAKGVTRDELLDLLPAGGARNAVDCALWDLEAKRARRPAWQLAALKEPRPVTTTYTLGADEPRKMAQRARDFTTARALKLKLTGTSEDAERVNAVRSARPDVWLGVDGNQGFTPEFLEWLMPELLDARVQLIEQPFPVERDADLDSVDSPIPIAADESAQDVTDLAALANRVDIVNIKLDKCGGLTRAFQMHAEARRLGMGVMVGCMGGTSLAMAPAFLLGQLCDVVDLDGPLLLSQDREPSVTYPDGRIWAGEQIWGGASS